MIGQGFGFQFFKAPYFNVGVDILIREIKDNKVLGLQ
jgi:hypothetical protein